MKKRILYLTDYELVAYQSAKKNGVLKEVGRFQNNEADIAAFTQYLHLHFEVPVFIIVDSIHEEYRHITVPHVVGKDRQDLLNHRKQRFFEHTPYSYAAVQGREKQGRGDDKVLFSAITSPELFEPWINLINKYKVPLAGIFSMPLLSEFLLNYFDAHPYTLLVTHTPRINEHSVQGLRQNFFFEKKLQVSRLVALSEADLSDNYTESVIKQIIITQRYLGSIRILPPSVELNVVLLAQPTYIDELQTYLQTNDVPEIHIKLVSCADFMKDEKQLSEMGCLHHLAGYYLLQNTPPNHYAKSTDTRYFIYHRLRLAMYSLSVLFLLSSAGYAALKSVEAWQILKQAQSVEQQVNIHQQQIDKLRALQPDLPADIEIIRTVVNYGRILTEQHISPHNMLVSLSTTLTQNRLVQLDKLSWGATDVEKGLFSQKPREIKPEEKPYIIQGLRINASVESRSGDYRQALLIYKRFLQDIKQTRQFSEIVEVQPPFDIAALSSSADNNPSSKKIAFILDLFIFHQYGQ
ncbi:hypothetical protein [Candidatus Albibeggiatoa sp. nov. NOAA]|uniref:hypothetical protein n=1 Tax=Candidatus Albibeggiatoa sp. nov. NOAA TaxID=3162724 RepID=UPI0032FE823F|nr:hypothetical protein [Thiotrichaceae bacterium]